MVSSASTVVSPEAAASLLASLFDGAPGSRRSARDIEPVDPTADVITSDHPKGLVSGVIPKDWSPFPAIEDEIPDLYTDPAIAKPASKEIEELFKKNSGKVRVNKSGFVQVAMPRSVVIGDQDHATTDAVTTTTTTTTTSVDNPTLPPPPPAITFSLSIRANNVSTRSTIFPNTLTQHTNKLKSDFPPLDDITPKPTYFVSATLPDPLAVGAAQSFYLSPTDENSNTFPLTNVKYDNILTPGANEARNKQAGMLTYLTAVPPKLRPGQPTSHYSLRAAGALYSAIHGQAVKAVDCVKPRNVKVAVKVNNHCGESCYVLGFQKQRVVRNASFLGLGVGAASIPSLPPPGTVNTMPMVKMQPDESCLVTDDDADSNFAYVLPVLHTLPLPTGELRTSCVRPGGVRPRDLNRTFGPASASAAAAAPGRCQICTGLNKGAGRMVCCDLCGITCHGDCLGDFDGGVQDGKTSEHSSSRKWVCGVCEDKRAPTSTRPPNEGKNGKPARVVRPTAKTEGNKVKVKWERPSHKCVLCVHSGGAMYKVSADKLFHDNCVSDGIIAPGEEGWVHDICKIAVKPRAALNMFEICAICGDEGSGSAPLVGLKSLSKCCVDGCNVLFHPMCAVAGNTIMGEAAARTVRAERLRRVEEKMEREKKEREKKKEEEEEEGVGSPELKQVVEVDGMSLVAFYNYRDRDLLTTSQFLIRFVHVKPDTSPDIEPVVFCGLHNPNRASQLLGLPPGGGGSIFEKSKRSVPADANVELEKWLDAVHSVAERKGQEEAAAAERDSERVAAAAAGPVAGGVKQGKENRGGGGAGGAFKKKKKKKKQKVMKVAKKVGKANR